MHSYLEPTAPIAPRALLTDDPKGAMDLATALCESPRMSNLSHGLWGYGGATAEGLEITIQSLGIGGPSAAAVVSELAELGVERAIRIGSCIALDRTFAPGSTFVGAAIEAADGVGCALSADGLDVVPSPDLTAALAAATGGVKGTIRSVDLAARGAAGSDGAGAFDLSSAGAVAAGSGAGIEIACALVVAEAADGERLLQEALGEALIALGMRAAGVLGGQDPAPGA